MAPGYERLKCIFFSTASNTVLLSLFYLRFNVRRVGLESHSADGPLLHPVLAEHVVKDLGEPGLWEELGLEELSDLDADVAADVQVHVQTAVQGVTPGNFRLKQGFVLPGSWLQKAGQWDLLHERKQAQNE